MKFRIAALAVFGLVMIAAAAQAQPSVEAGATGIVPAVGPGVLYDQTDNASGNGAPDQDFEAAYDAYDSEGADDFVVTSPTGWEIEEVNTVGTSGGGSDSVAVNFYPDNAGFPDAAATCSYTGIVANDAGGSLNIVLPTSCILPMGTHWVAIQVSQNFGTDGQHFWSNRTTASNSGAVWRNPGGGFGTTCTDWDRMTTCGVGGGTNPDFLFQLIGQDAMIPVDLQSFEVD